MGRDPLSGELYFFLNKRCTRARWCRLEGGCPESPEDEHCPAARADEVAVPALACYQVGMAKPSKQYTVRNVPPSVDRALRKKAAARQISLNELVLRALEVEAGVTVDPAERHDLDAFFGSWVSDPDVDRALAGERVIDLRDWAEEP